MKHPTPFSAVLLLTAFATLSGDVIISDDFESGK